MPQTCSLSGLCRPDGIAAFRAFNDPATSGESPAVPPGFWVDDVKVGGPLISEARLAGWKSFTETKANTVDGFTVWIVSIDTKKKAASGQAAQAELRLHDQGPGEGR